MKKSLSFALMLITLSICTLSLRAKVVTVNVDIPGTLGSLITTKVDQLSDVSELTVIGKLNDSDFNVFALLKNVEKIDLSQTDINYIRGCRDLKKMAVILLPSTVTEVKENAFYSCHALKLIKAENAQIIGENAFRDCNVLTQVSFPNVTNIGKCAFYDCTSLATSYFPNVINIMGYAFYHCTSLTTVDFPNAISIASWAFGHCTSLKSMRFPLATTIREFVFAECPALISVNFSSVEHVGTGAFSDCGSLTTVVLPKSVKRIGVKAFDYCYNLKDVYCNVALPLGTTAFSSYYLKLQNTTLHVSAFSIGTYQLDSRWNKFGKIVALDGRIDNVGVGSNFSVVELKGLAEKSDLTISLGSVVTGSLGADYTFGHLTVSSKEKWQIKDYVQTQTRLYDNQSYYDKNNCYTTLIPYSEMIADNVIVKYTFKTNCWNFISLPFDVNVSDIEYPEGTLWVIRKYSGEDRAKVTGKTWQNMTNGMILKAGEGYILQCSNSASGSSEYKEFTFKAVNSSNKNNIFASKDVAKSLSTYMSDLPHNRSWNLVGNPYPCFYDTRHMEHNGVITVWNGSGYTAYSLVDDNYVLKPHEAFFVQCPDGASSMKFKAEGRQHTYEVASQSTPYRKSPANSCRREVYNFTLSGADYTDKARVVINESATTDYELSCDASKFVSDNPLVPQLYIIEDNQQMAIDERPLSDGEIALGMYIGEPSEYTIALDNVSADNVTLIDSATGNTVNLNTDTYTFAASRGTIDDRFVIQIGEATGVKEVPTDERSAKTTVYGIGGQKLSNPQKGINIINGNKILVR